MRTRTLLTAAIAALATCGATTAVPAQAIVKQKRAHFSATISGLETTKWVSKSGTYTDCNGTARTTGEGTEVIRFASTHAEKVTYFGFGSRLPTLDYNGWFSSPSIDLGFSHLVRGQITRHGQYTHTWSGGWCRGPRSEFSDISDCGTHRGTMDVRFDPTPGGKVSVEARPFNTNHMESFGDCPVNTPSGITAAAWTLTKGRLSSKLLFGKQKKIVVVDGKTYRRHDTAPGVDATTTTYFKLTLKRVHPKKVRPGESGAG